eukprot:CAMPEP_0198442054 /NCGR_PEP_ID=MMETSP1452-20131203/65112_1 /TAXON_ID=1181717 /ORGANISM="Synchroma pusillum, Strain CCMP3072" /LENGTH=210 /DNA_ID=CAMNT_0044162685 /DNA_START=18 /DNA_END=648 /DNA_ORIENTATION=+
MDASSDARTLARLCGSSPSTASAALPELFALLSAVTAAREGAVAHLSRAAAARTTRASHVVELARAMTFTLAAPPGWAPGAPLLGSHPPAPQAEQMRAGLLGRAAALAGAPERPKRRRAGDSPAVGGAVASSDPSAGPAEAPSGPPARGGAVAAQSAPAAVASAPLGAHEGREAGAAAKGRGGDDESNRVREHAARLRQGCRQVRGHLGK